MNVLIHASLVNKGLSMSVYIIHNDNPSSRPCTVVSAWSPSPARHVNMYIYIYMSGKS